MTLRGAPTKRPSVGWGKEPNHAEDRQWHRAPWNLHRFFFPHHTWRKWREAGYFNISDRSVYKPGKWIYATTRQRAQEALRERCSGEVFRIQHGHG